MAEDLFQSRRIQYVELDTLATSLESASKAGDQDFWKCFSAHARTGIFDDLDVFKGLMKAVSIRTERDANGKGTTGMPFQKSFDDFVMTLAAMSPKSAQLFMDNFAGRSSRSQRQIRSLSGMQLKDGLCPENFVKISQHLIKLGYTGPVCVALDQTVCVKSL